VVNSRTSLVAQTAWHASVAEIAQEAVARARIVPEDVRLVMAKVVAGDGVVPGFRRYAVERIGRDYDPARDTGGPRGDVAREVVARKLHTTRAEKRDADPRERLPALLETSWALSGVVLDRVGFHLEVTYRSGRESFEEHASAVVVDRVSGEGAAVGVGDPDAPRTRCRSAPSVVSSIRAASESVYASFPSICTDHSKCVRGCNTLGRTSQVLKRGLQRL
jgi:hypothetical protein